MKILFIDLFNKYLLYAYSMSGAVGSSGDGEWTKMDRNPWCHGGYILDV